MFPSRGARRWAPVLASALAAASLSLSARPASAYSGSGAASYADTWATSFNNMNYPVFSADCTNFVSQAVSHGGYPFRNYNGGGTDSWWIYATGPDPGSPGSGLSVYNYSPSWSLVVDYYDLLAVDIPGGVRAR
ncbi:MAG: amidase domain-containing protein [Sciscionella sp.]